MSGHVILHIFMCQIQSFPLESMQYWILCNGESVPDFPKGLSWSHKVGAFRKSRLVWDRLLFISLHYWLLKMSGFWMNLQIFLKHWFIQFTNLVWMIHSDWSVSWVLIQFSIQNSKQCSWRKDYQGWCLSQRVIAHSVSENVFLLILF